jgi:hypothetical protein
MLELSPRCEGEFKPKFEAFYQKISTLPRCAEIPVEARVKRTK